eukprot:COSAG02_NODE_883_length_16194_cov_11.902765_13_plen_431_part_00
MDPLTLKILTELAPYVHELDASCALDEVSALVRKFKARKTYHEATFAVEVDVMEDKYPRLNRYPEEGAARAWSEGTARNFKANIVHLCAQYHNYDPEQCSINTMCNDALHVLKETEWYLDTAKCIECAYKNQNDKNASTRMALERINSIAQLCDMYHTPAALKAAEEYRRHAASVRTYHESAKCVQESSKKRRVEPEPEQGAQDTDSGSDVGEEAPELSTVRAALGEEYTKIVELHSKDMKSFLRAARNWLLFAAWLGVGELYEDTLVPMRTDLETARFGKELIVKDGELWFETPRAVGCTKTSRIIKWNISKHSPMVADVLLKMQDASLDLHDGYLWPKTGDCTKPRPAQQIANSRKSLATQGRAYGLPVGFHTIQKMRHLSKRGMPPRTPDETKDQAYRRGSSVEAMMKYGNFTTNATSMEVEAGNDE